MVEGHSVHRVAASHRRRLVGKKFACTSPNGRFTEGAAAINNKTFRAIEAVGKNLFAWFGNGDDDDVCVHVHFGMAGNWAVFDGDEPATTATTRLRMEQLDGRGVEEQPIEGHVVSHLSAMTVKHGSRAGLYEPKRATLGEDPLRDDADVERLWKKVSRSKKSIGALIMDQSCFCGPGNIYRAEILFKARIHPDQLGKDLSRAQFDEVWRHSVELLKRGFTEGVINTVDGQTGQYIYNKSGCPICSGQVSEWMIDKRRAYACLTCQPLRTVAAPPSPKRTKKRAAATTPTKAQKAESTPKPVKRFRSQCIIEDSTEGMTPEMLTVKELKAKLSAHGAPTDGLKGMLVARLTALEPPMRSAEDAAADRALVYENRAVEHVADLHPTQAVRAARKARARK
jgi:formamidopyrimidine-DNA glycosylase